jgi:hypothetical protein
LVLRASEALSALDLTKDRRPSCPDIYAKIGVSTRAAAAMFAMEHDLLVHM